MAVQWRTGATVRSKITESCTLIADKGQQAVSEYAARRIDILKRKYSFRHVSGGWAASPKLWSATEPGLAGIRGTAQ